jgi:hypothetical protein
MVTHLKEIICEACGGTFHRYPSQIPKHNFCSKDCRKKGKDIPCEFCGKLVYRYSSNTFKHNFCSRACQTSYNKVHPLIGEQARHWMGGITHHKRICKYCKKEFITKHPDGNFCCREHLHKWRSENLAGTNSPCYNSKEVPCTQCGKLISSPPNRTNRAKHGIFCSKECHYKWNSENFIGIKSPSFKSKFVNCIMCGKEFRLTPHWEKLGRIRYCSQDCYWKDISNRFSGENHPRWCGGDKVYCEKWNLEFRRRIRAFHNYTCVECGTPQNGRKLHCHHVYYNKKACCEVSGDGKYYTNLGIKNAPFDFEIIGDPNKFVALCDHCHHVTSGKKNRAYWARHFETIINGYYEGKSYFTKEEYKQLTYDSSQTDHRLMD